MKTGHSTQPSVFAMEMTFKRYDLQILQNDE